LTTNEGAYAEECAIWQAKLERSFAEKLKLQLDDYIKTIQDYTEAMGQNRVVIEDSGATQFIDVVMLDSEYMALFEYFNNPETGASVNVLHISDTDRWEAYIDHYESRVFQLKDIKKLRIFHRNHLNVFMQKQSAEQ